MITSNPVKFFLITLPVSLLFLFLSIWLFRNINYKNMEKKWFRVLFGSSEWTSVVQAIKFMNEIEEFKKETL
jgi:hypothetical protein